MTLLDPTALNQFEKDVSLRLDQIGQYLKSQGEEIVSLRKRISDLEKGASIPPKLLLRRKLTLPVNKYGEFSGEAMEIPYSMLMDGYKDQFYNPLKNGDLELFVPAKGATTDNAKYPRTEERWYLCDPAAPVRADGFDEMINMKRGEFTWKKRRTITFTDLPEKGKVVIRQSHAVEAPPDWKVMCTGKGQMYILCKRFRDSTTDDRRIDLAMSDQDLISLYGADVDIDAHRAAGVMDRLVRKGQGFEPFELYTDFDGNVLNVSLNGGALQLAEFDKTSLWYPKGDGLYNAAATDVRAIMHKEAA